MDSAAELNLELIESNKEEKQEQIGRDENPSAEDILKQIQMNFGDSIAKAFQGHLILFILFWHETAIQLFLSSG